MTEAVLRFVDNLGVSFSFALVMGAGCALGSIVWFAWGPGQPAGVPAEDGWEARAERDDRMSGMTVGEFFRRVTLQSTQGRLCLWLCAANLALAAVLPFFADRVPHANTIALVAAFYPLFLFFYHIATFWKFGSSWFSMVMLSVMALIPGWKIVVVDLLGWR